MQSEEGLSEENMPFTGLPDQSSLFNNKPFPSINLQQSEQNWENSLMLDYGSKIESLFSKFNQAPENLSTMAGCSSYQNTIPNPEDTQKKQIPNWDSSAMLSNLSFLEQKIHQLQDLVHIIIGRTDEQSTQQQQLITADLTSIIIQLISTAGSLLPSVKNGLLASTANVSDVQINQMDVHEMKDEDDPIDEEHLPPGSYEILQLEKEEILAPHTHFCTICGKGFKRDANLRMHMRGHGDEYKTPAALAKPHKNSDELEPIMIKRYSCPYTGCKRNKDHKKFQPLKTILCVKNHYKRTHCDKTYTCSRCNTKKFSVIADLKTHEKHCGRDKWLCSCGTTFSRKDKLFGHIALFQGHTPAIPVEENNNKGCLGGGSSSVPGDGSNEKLDSTAFSFGNGMIDVKGGNMDDSYYSLMGFDNMGSAFDDSGSSFPFLIPAATTHGLQSDSVDPDL